MMKVQPPCSLSILFVFLMLVYVSSLYALSSAGSITRLLAKADEELMKGLSDTGGCCIVEETGTLGVEKMLPLDKRDLNLANLSSHLLSSSLSVFADAKSEVLGW